MVEGTQARWPTRAESQPHACLVAPPPQTGLLAGAFDCVVHSLKDVPTTLPDGLALVAISDREDPRDCVLLPADASSAEHADGLAALRALAPGSCVGTSSLRREALLAARCDGLVTHAVRGNLNTRYAKLCGEHDSCAQPGAPQYKALLLAAAGVQRLGWQERVAGYLPGDEWPWGVGQGSLGVEVKCTLRGAVVGALIKRAVGDSAGTAACVAERAFLKELQGGCQVPLGTYTTQADASERAVHVAVKGVVLSGDGATELSATVEADIPKMTNSQALPSLYSGLSFTHMWCSEADAELVAQAEALGKALAQPLLAKGAAALIHGESRGITYGKA